MDLITAIKQKNDQLSLQNIQLQQHLRFRVDTPQFRSFLTTFVILPFVVGVAAQLALKSKNPTASYLLSAVLPGLKFLPLLRITA